RCRRLSERRDVERRQAQTGRGHRLLQRRASDGPVDGLEHGSDRNPGTRQSVGSGRGHHALGRKSQGKPGRAGTRGFSESRRSKLDEAYPVLGRRPGRHAVRLSDRAYEYLDRRGRDRRAQGKNLLGAGSMAEFSLPANSKIRKDGRVYKAPAGAANVRVFKIYRFDPDLTENPRLDTYEVDMD